MTKNIQSTTIFSSNLSVGRLLWG